MGQSHWQCQQWVQQGHVLKGCKQLWVNPGKGSQEDLQELSLSPRAGRNGKDKGTALVYAVPRDIYTSTTVQVSLCTPWDPDFTPDTAAQALQALTFCSESTKLVSEYTCSFFRIVSSGRSSQEYAWAARGEVLRGEVLLLFSLGYLIYKYMDMECDLYFIPPSSIILAGLSLSLSTKYSG